MKTLRRLSLLFCTILFFSCSKQDSNTTGNTPLTGTWKLAETLADPGDGSGTWKPVSRATQTLLTFTADGRIEGNAFPQARSYERVNDTNLKFIFADGTFIFYTYTISGSTLIISGGGCIEACGAKFTKTSIPHL